MVRPTCFLSRALESRASWQPDSSFHVPLRFFARIRSFRHSFASNLAAAGIDEHVIAALMGHLTQEMQARYRHLFPHQRRSAVTRVYG